MTAKTYPYSPTTGCTYVPGFHADLPDDVVLISEECYQSVIANPAPGRQRGHLPDGTPYLMEPERASEEALCKQVDDAAAECGRTVIGDPLKVLEYDRAAIAARQFREAGFPALSVPPAVAAWAINGRSPEQAALDIIDRAEQLEEKLQFIRAARLAAKERIREFLASGDQAQAEGEALAAVGYFQGLAGATA